MKAIDDRKKNDVHRIHDLIMKDNWSTAYTEIHCRTFTDKELISFFEATIVKQSQSARILYINIIENQPENLRLNFASNYLVFLTAIINKIDKGLLKEFMDENYPRQQVSVSQPSPAKENHTVVIKMAKNSSENAKPQAGSPAKAGKEDDAALQEEIKKLKEVLDRVVEENREVHARIAQEAVKKRRDSLFTPSRIPVPKDEGRRASFSGRPTNSTSSIMGTLAASSSEKKPAESRRSSISGSTPTSISDAPKYLRKSVPVFHTPANKASGALTLTRTASSAIPALSTKRASESETNLPAKKPASVRAAAALGSFFGKPLAKTPAKTTPSNAKTPTLTPFK